MNLVKDYKQYFTPDKLAEYMVNMIPDLLRYVITAQKLLEMMDFSQKRMDMEI